VKFARIIGRLTLNVADPSYSGSRLLVGIPSLPKKTEFNREDEIDAGNSFVIYDNLGASEGDLIAYTDGGEASAPFELPTPCDAYCAAIVDEIFWNPLNEEV
jgi:ethanolamine utilization protein EutN